LVPPLRLLVTFAKLDFPPFPAVHASNSTHAAKPKRGWTYHSHS
jgi:hypothetical protein